MFDPKQAKRNKFYPDPIKGFVYFLFSGDEIVYVGMTKDHLVKRINAHVAVNKISFDSYTAIAITSGCAESVEAYYISLYKPVHNKTLLNRSMEYPDFEFVDSSLFHFNKIKIHKSENEYFIRGKLYEQVAVIEPILTGRSKRK